MTTFPKTSAGNHDHISENTGGISRPHFQKHGREIDFVTPFTDKAFISATMCSGLGAHFDNDSNDTSKEERIIGVVLS